MERVDDLRALARLVVDLLVRARGEERRERVDDRAAARVARARPPPRPCPARRSRTRGSGPGTRARRRGRGSRRRGRRRGRRGARARRRARTSSSPYASTTYSSVTVAPRSGADSRARPRARLRRRLRGVDRLERERLEPERREPRADSLDELGERPLERLVVGRAGVPAVRPASLAQRGRMLHERDALALDRPRDERLRPIVAVANDAKAARQRARGRARRTSATCQPNDAELAPRDRRARRSRPSACPTGARCGRRRPSGRPSRSCAARLERPRSSGPPAARRRRS